MIGSKAAKRHNAILDIVAQDNAVSVEFLCQTLQCSPSTIRNDLNYLANQQKLIRTFGGAKALDKNENQILQNAASGLSEDTAMAPGNDREIAQYVVEHLIAPHATIILEGSNTALDIARLIARRQMPVSVLTFSLPVINILADVPTVNLYNFGGFYSKKRSSFLNDFIAEQARMLHADIYFMQVAAVNPEAGFTIPCPDIPVTERTLMNMSTRTIALSDSSNLCRSTYRIIADFSVIDTLVTDSNANPEHVRHLREAGLNVLLPQKAAADMV